MDEKLDGYINSQPQTPPVITEREIVNELAQRRKRLHFILLSLSGLLWAVALYSVSFMVGRQNQVIGISLLTAISVGYMCAGCFAVIVIKFRKVGI